MLSVDVLFSSSRGNSALVRCGSSQILIDCGRSARAVCTSLRELGTGIENISDIFISHEHSDHISALDRICAGCDVPVHMTEASAAARVYPFEKNVVVHPLVYTYTAGEITVSSFPLPHDSAAHVGFVIEDSSGDTFGIATDMGHVTDEAIENLSRCRRVMIEANHDIQMLEEGYYPPFLKRRILSPRGHLSNTDCASLACTLASRGCEVIALAHLSPENNVPGIAYSEIRASLDAAGYGDCETVVADRDFTLHVPDGPGAARNKDVSYAEN